MYDVAVVGVGSMGAFACLELAQRGLRVLGIDRWQPPHTHGSHSGETRVYREAYAEHPDYVPLAVLAGKLWEQHGAAAGRTLLTRCGQINIGRPESPLLNGVLHSAQLHSISVSSLDTDTLRHLYPEVRVLDGEVAVVEPGAGWVDVDASLEYALKAARAHGAELRLNSAVDAWTQERGAVTLHLADGQTLQAQKLIVCAGAWSSQLLPSLNLPLRVVRKVLAWAQPRESLARAAEKLPVLTFADKVLYTFPARDGLFKMAVHATGEEIRTDPEQVHAPEPDDLIELIEEASSHLAPLFGEGDEVRQRIRISKTCLYTMTPDEHFVLDRIAGAPVCFGAGFSGHGFKFAPAIGRVLAEMSLQESPSAPVAFLSADRFNRSTVPVPALTTTPSPVVAWRAPQAAPR